MTAAPTDPRTYEQASADLRTTATSGTWRVILGVLGLLVAVALVEALVPAARFEGWRQTIVAMTVLALVFAWKVPVDLVAGLIRRRLTLDVLAMVAIVSATAWSVNAYVDGGAALDLVVAIVVVAVVVACKVFVARAGVADDDVPRWYVPAALSLALVALGAWMAVDGRPSRALAAAVAVTVAAAPGALAVAAPAAYQRAIRCAAGLGVGFDGLPEVKATSQIHGVVLRGLITISSGKKVSSIDPIGTEDDRNLRWFAGALEHHSAHPIGRAIAKLAPRGRVTGVEHVEGHGITGSVDRHPVRVGEPTWIGLCPEGGAGNGSDDGADDTVVGVEVDARPLGTITLVDVVRPTAADGVTRLRQRGVDVTLVSEAHSGPASRLAGEVGITEVLTGDETVLAAKLVDERRAAGERVGVVSAGPDSGGTLTVSGGSADCDHHVALWAPDPAHASTAVRLASAATDLGRTGRHFAIGFSGVAALVAAAGLLVPFTAALVMAGGAVLALLAAQRLRS